MSQFEAVQPYRLAREIANQLSTMILQGKLFPGTRLPAERDLASQFNVSRPTLREAIHVLESLGLAEIRPGDGTFVSQNPSALSSHALELIIQKDGNLLVELAEVRREFEARNAELAATQVTDAEIERLRTIYAKMEEDVVNARDGFENDLDFHLLIAEASRNRIRLFVTTSLVMAHFQALKEARQWFITRRSNVADLFLVEHRNIYEAIRARNSKQAGEAMTVHMTASYERYASMIR